MRFTNRSATQQNLENRKVRTGISGAGWIFMAMTALLLLTSRVAFAQYDTGSVIGVIQDSTGAVVPGASRECGE